MYQRLEKENKSGKRKKCNDEGFGKSSKKGESSKICTSNNKKFKKNVDMKNVKCYCC